MTALPRAQVVLDLLNFRKPMALLTHDGGIPVPPPGVLFYAVEPWLPTVFRSPEEAEAAVTASVTYRSAAGSTNDSRGDYLILDADVFVEIEEENARRSKKRRGKR